MSAEASAGWMELDGLTKSYGRTPALIQLTRSVARGERLILAGPNGAGKSTLLRLVAGLIRPSSGSVRVAGRSLDQDYRCLLGYLDHRSFLYQDLTGAENLRFFGGLYGVAVADELLERVGLADQADLLVAAYSRGMRQRLSLARALLSDPEVLLLDEPFTGLDEAGVGVAQSLLREWLGRGERTLMVASHDFERLVGIAGGMLVLRNGRLVAEILLDGLDGEGLRARYREVVA